jgi:hypothetical protein
MTIASGAWAAPVAQETDDRVIVVSETPADILEPAVVEASDSASSFQFAAFIPPGGSLMPLDGALEDEAFSTEVLVKDAAGAVVGAYDAPHARDANGALLPATYRVVGDDLIQTVDVSAADAFPVLVDLAGFEPVRYGPAGPTVLSHFITIPSNYVYNPSLGSLHDYCTLSPDYYRPLGAPNADFRGPCARHDMCYEAPGNNKSACDTAFRNNLIHMCDNTYGSVNPIRYTCRTVAEGYYLAVVTFGDDPSLLASSTRPTRIPPAREHEPSTPSRP